VFALLTLIATSAFMAGLTGAIFTTDSTCSGIDLNIYPNKDAVYIDGGPDHPSGSSLPEGSYYVRVTEPDGTELGTSIGGALGDTPFQVDSNGDSNCYQLSAILVTVPGGLPGYNDTTNGGDEYKVCVFTDTDFTESNCKTDNFKVKSGGSNPDGALQVLKFYDADTDGEKDPGEPYLEGWKFDLSPAIGTNPLSTSFFSIAPPGVYTATERDPIQTNWVASTLKTLSTVVVVGDTSVIEFGNYCTLSPGGRTIGFWSNKNGQSLLTAADFTALNALCLRNADGSDRDFTQSLSQNKTALKNWLLGATATNMAYMLSAQLAATVLNVRHGFTDATIFVEGSTTVADLITHADGLLCADGYTLAGNPDRAPQEHDKNLLDQTNNGGSFVQPNADRCPYTFAP